MEVESCDNALAYPNVLLNIAIKKYYKTSVPNVNGLLPRPTNFSRIFFFGWIIQN
jgi:hypothetical protein